LVVRGERPLPFAGRPLAVRHLEIPYGAFERRIPLPAGRFDAGTPELSQGCLILRLRRSSSRRKSIWQPERCSNPPAGWPALPTRAAGGRPSTATRR